MTGEMLARLVLSRMAEQKPSARLLEDGLPKHSRVVGVQSSRAVPSGVPHVGRNAPCPCNSGKKFKHCCGASK